MRRSRRVGSSVSLLLIVYLFSLQVGVHTGLQVGRHTDAVGGGTGGAGGGGGGITGQYFGLPNFFPPGAHLSPYLLPLLLLPLLLLPLLESLLLPELPYLEPFDDSVSTAPRFRLLTYFVFSIEFAALL